MNRRFNISQFRRIFYSLEERDKILIVLALLIVTAVFWIVLTSRLTEFKIDSIAIDIKYYAREVFGIEAREADADVAYWAKRISSRARAPGEDGASAAIGAYSNIDDEKIARLKELRDELKKIPVPPGCGKIHRKFLAAKNRRIETLEKSASRSSRLPLAGMSDSEYREAFGDWVNSDLRLESQSYTNYKEAWSELARRLPKDFDSPPFGILDYEYRIYEANIKGWLVGLSYPDEREKFRIWHGYVTAVEPPKECAGIHSGFIKADQLKMESAGEGLTEEEREDLSSAAAEINEKAWLELKELIRVIAQLREEMFKK